MRKSVRLIAGGVLAWGTVIGPAGCSDYWDLDPEPRVIHDGPYLDLVVACSEKSFGLAEKLRAGDWPNSFVAEDIAFLDHQLPTIYIMGTTEYGFSGERVRARWTCEKHVDDPSFRTELVSYREISAG